MLAILKLWAIIGRIASFHSITTSCVMASDFGNMVFHKCQRLISVVGDGGKTNDMVYCKRNEGMASGNVIYFGGDVQDFTENMQQHRDNHRHQAWNLERTAEIISGHFPDSNIWVVKPVRMHLKTFSVYSNFMQANMFGNPTHEEGGGSWEHLRKLLNNAERRMKNSGGKDECEVEQSENSAETLEKTLPTTLVAFSKGCVVLNQLLYDLPQAKNDPKQKTFLETVSDFYWLDGGHSGGSNIWINDDEILQQLASLNVDIFVHVTPYQVKDQMRKYIGKEERKFVDKLKKHGGKVTEKLHFSDQAGSLLNHFKVLEVFRNMNINQNC